MRATSTRFLILCLGLAALLPLTSCSSDKDIKAQKEESVEVLYKRAEQAMKDKKYEQATKDFDEVERQHPYSQYATQAQLQSAYASYLGQHYDEALVALDRFIELHPGNDDVDYAYYLKALCYYEQISDVKRDQENTHEALDALDAVIKRFPDSKYAREASLKRDLTMDHLAGKEMEVGRYYENRGYINAAINRYREVVKDYQTTTHAAEALYRLVECYMILGLPDEAVRVAAVLGHNYPGSKWYEKAYALMDAKQRTKIMDDRSWVDRTVESLLRPD